MKVYVVTADTWGGGYGSKISLFGVYATQENAEERKENIAKLGYIVEINEISLNTAREIYLGGYVE